ncbi:hypothetical protein ACMGDH_11220 [Sphingomonas sp. DT-207]|uniref:hypothetical protein n=1 Tax=Sphingomonas sp. DT-207 TaxID=3396167 RepID=UPI003F19FFDD
MKPKAPVDSVSIRAAMRESRAVRAALARLRPADRAHAGQAIGDAIAARLRREGWPK